MSIRATPNFHLPPPPPFPLIGWIYPCYSGFGGSCPETFLFHVQGPLLAQLMSMQAAGNLPSSRPGNGLQLPYPMGPGGAMGPPGPQGSSQMPLGGPQGSLLNMMPGAGPPVGQGGLSTHNPLWQPTLPGQPPWAQGPPP